MKLSKSKCIIFYNPVFCCAATTFHQTLTFSVEKKYINSAGDTLLYRQLYPDSDTFRKLSSSINFFYGSGER